MHMLTQVVWVVLFAAGLAVFLKRYRGTRACLPGVVALALATVTSTGHFVLAVAWWLLGEGTVDLHFWVPASNAATDAFLLTQYLALLCLIGTIFSLAGPASNATASREIGFAAVVGAIGILAIHVSLIAREPWFSRYVLSFIQAPTYLLASIAVLRRFRRELSGILACTAFAVMGLIGVGAPIMSEKVAQYGIGPIHLAGWAIVLWFLAVVATQPRVRTTSPGDFPPIGPDGLKDRAPALVIIPTLLLFYWLAYEAETGGALLSRFTWVKIPLTLVLLVIVYAMTLWFLAVLFGQASALLRKDQARY